MNVVFFLLVDSPASEFYVPTFRNTVSVPSSEVTETSAYYNSDGGESLKKNITKNAMTLFHRVRQLVYSKNEPHLGGRRPCMEWCSRKEESGIAWLLGGVWQMKEMIRNTDKGRYPLYLCEDDVRHALLDC